MSFKDEMEQFDEQWSEDQTKSGILDDGEYDVEIVESRVDSGEYGFTWVIKFTGEEGSIRKFNNLDNEKSREFSAMDAKRLGYDGKLSDLEEANEKEQFIGLKCRIKVVTKSGTDRDYKNTYINEVYGKSAIPKGSSGAAGTDDDIPF